MRQEFEAVIGLECHVQLTTASKLFCSAATAFGAAENTQTDPLTLGLPGTLPVPNRRAVELAVRLGLALGCTIALRSRFARKHYHYPDLPKGYQISQYEEPICLGGAIPFVWKGQKRSVRLIRIHMEEDAGKNTHLPSEGLSLVDLNRAGVPLCEVVTEPDLRDPEEAAECLRALRRIVRYLGVSDGNMEEGSLRCDANVSLREVGQSAYGVKTELKNINSFRFVQRAIEHEINRQRDVLERGGMVVQETRGWDAERGTSHSQRSKEEAHDYRYLPDPDLPELVLSPKWLEEVKQTLPETPEARQVRYASLRLPEQDVALLCSEPEYGPFFERALAASSGAAPKLVANWIGSELLGAMNRDGRVLADVLLSPEQLGELLALIYNNQISGKIGKELFAKLYSGDVSQGTSPKELVTSLGLSQVSDRALLTALCNEVVKDPNNSKQVEKYRAGADRLLGFFVGQVLKRSGGRANPELVNEILLTLLKD